MATSGVVLSPVKEDSIFSPRCFHGRDANLSDDIQIFLSMAGSGIPMRVLPWDTIASVKMKIQVYKGFYVKQQRLVYEGRELARNDSLIKDYGVTNGKVLHLVIRRSDLLAVTVKTVNGKEYAFQLKRSSSIRDLKHRIAQKECSLRLDEQELVLKGKQLEDQRLVDDLSLSENDIIHLFVRQNAKVRTRSNGTYLELSVDTPPERNQQHHDIQCDDLTEKMSSVQLAVRPPKLSPEKRSNYRDSLIEYQTLVRELPRSRYLLEPVTASSRHKLSQTLQEMIKDMREGLASGQCPVMSKEGSGGAYFMHGPTGTKYIGVFKPIDEEPMAVNNPRGLPISLNGEGMKKGTRVGEGAYREIAAYILDHPLSGPRSLVGDEIGFAGVPPTMMIRCSHSAFHLAAGFDKSGLEPKMGSLQKFVESYSNCEDMGPAAFPVDEVHKITVLDLRLANADRHGGNILVCRGGESSISLVPIDHGYCLPENFEDCTFEWLYWPQARQPYKYETLKYIESLDADKDIELLKFHGWNLSLECSRVLRVSTMLLKKGAAAGLTPYEIALVMCRESLNKPSDIENILEEAQEAVLPASREETFLEVVSQIMDCYLANIRPSTPHYSMAN
uniref:1-phosphatidylinositol 4-kinase n=1 Tax=Wollemia nobilis TaxID=56998 RepID=A0A0C9RLB9_9CONI